MKFTLNPQRNGTIDFNHNVTEEIKDSGPKHSKTGGSGTGVNSANRSARPAGPSLLFGERSSD